MPLKSHPVALSPLKGVPHPDDDGEEFHDYTLATAWEKLSAMIEHCLHNWISKDILREQERQSAHAAHLRRLKLTTHLRHTLPFRSDTYILSAHLPPPLDSTALLDSPNAAQSGVLGDQPHKLQTWFGADPFLVLEPNSNSGRILEKEEANTLLSAAAVALSHLRLPWPLFIPVHDFIREAYRGIAVHPNGCIIRYESESDHRSSLNQSLCHFPGQLQLFAKLLGAYNARCAGLCEALASPDTHIPSAVRDLVTKEGLRVRGHMKRSYGVPDVSAHERGGNELEIVIDDWDVEAPWRPWAAHEDPIGCLELDLVWDCDLSAPVSSDTHHYTTSHTITKDTSAEYAAIWRLAALSPQHIRDDGHRGLLSLNLVDQRRKFLKLHQLSGLPTRLTLPALIPSDHPEWGNSIGRSGRDKARYGDEDEEESAMDTLAGMLSRMLRDAEFVHCASATGQLTSVEWWLHRVGYVPPIPVEGVLQDAIRDVFQSPKLPDWPGVGLRRFENNLNLVNKNNSDAGSQSVTGKTGVKSSRGPLGKAAPLESLASRLALHALVLGNPHAVAALWQRFLRELRFMYWEGRQRLPRMAQQTTAFPEDSDSTAGSTQQQGISTQDSLLHQKLVLLDFCIEQQQSKTASPPVAGGHQLETDMASPLSSNGGSSSAYLSAGGASAQSLQSLGSEESTELSTMSPGENGLSLDVSRPSSAAESASAPTPASDSEVEGVKEVLEGQYLLNKSTEPLRIPVTQHPPLLTEDMIAERHAAETAWLSRPAKFKSPPPAGATAQIQGSKELPDGGGAHKAAVIARSLGVEGALLLSDMQAFKAANPGCRFEDFIRWHSPKDWITESPPPPSTSSHDQEPSFRDKFNTGTGRVSARMADKSNNWNQLWEAAQAIPVCRQKPLFQASLEGERALHFLEVLPPAVLYSELMALGLSAALELLEQGESAALPAVQAQLTRFREIASGMMRNGVAAWKPPQSSPGATTAAAPGINPVTNPKEEVESTDESTDPPPPVSVSDISEDVVDLPGEISEQEGENKDAKDKDPSPSETSSTLDDTSLHDDANVSDEVRTHDHAPTEKTRITTNFQGSGSRFGEMPMTRLPSGLTDLFTCGCDPKTLAYLLEALYTTEKSVVAGQSLLLRLGGGNGLLGALGSKPRRLFSPFAVRVANALVMSAMDGGHEALHGTVVSIESVADRAMVIRLMRGEVLNEDIAGAAADDDDNDGGSQQAEGSEAKDWNVSWKDTDTDTDTETNSHAHAKQKEESTSDKPQHQQQQRNNDVLQHVDIDEWEDSLYQTEWLVEVLQGEENSDELLQRLYVKRLAAELRVATVITTEHQKE